MAIVFMCRGTDGRVHVNSVVSAQMHGVTKRSSFIVLILRTQVPVSFVRDQLVDIGGPCRSIRPRRLLQQCGGVVNGPAVYYSSVVL